MAKRATLFLATALTLPAAALAEAPFAFDRTPGKLPKNVVPIAYRIDIVPDLVKLTLTGRETIDIDVRTATRSITLNQAGLAIMHATLETKAAAMVAKDDAKQTATLRFNGPVAPGRHVLTIDYTGSVPQTPAGIYYDDYKTRAGAARRMLVTQFEVADARRMFPGWDEPAFKATFQLSVTLPHDLVAISNMPIASTTPAGLDHKHVVFQASPRMSTYLLALIAGDMAAVRAKAGPTDLAAWAPTGEQSQAQYALEVETHVLPFYNEYFGVPYPLPKLDLIAIPGNFEAGAMENWGAITFIDDGMLFDPATSSPATRERIHVYVAHEMAHQWSGDLVTMGWWDNIWLNEGFATWMEYKATDHFNPDWQIWPRQHDAREEAMAQDAQPTTHAIQQVIRDETEANTAFDEISYQKGEQIIRMIEDWIGPDTFRTGMRAYMKAHAYGNTTSADLWAALGKASGRDVGHIAAAFTEQPGIPLVQVARTCDAGQARIMLTQDRFTIHDPAPKKLAWTIPVTVGAPGTAPQRTLLERNPATLTLAGCDAPAKVNLGEDGYYRTQYDAASLAALTRVLPKLDPADRANLLGDQFALFLANRAPLASYLDLLAALHDETNIAVWQDTLAHLRRLDATTRGTPTRPTFRAFAAGLIRPAFARIGWDAKPGEPYLDTLLRPDLIQALGRYDDPAITAEAKRRFAAFVTNPSSLAPALRDPVLGIVGHHADQKEWDQLRALGIAATSTEEKLRYFSAMAAAEDPALVTRNIAFATAGEVPNGRVASFIAETSRLSDQPEQVWREVLPVQNAIRAKLTEASQSFLLPAASIGSSDPAIARALLAAPASNNSTGAKVIAARAADGIETIAEVRARALPALVDWLGKAGK